MHGTVEFIFMLVKSGYSKETCKENLFGTFIKPTFLTSNEIATRVCLLWEVESGWLSREYAKLSAKKICKQLGETFIWIIHKTLCGAAPFMHCLHCVKGLAGCIGPFQTTFVRTLSPPFCTLLVFRSSQPPVDASSEAIFSLLIRSAQRLVLIWICRGAGTKQQHVRRRFCLIAIFEWTFAAAACTQIQRVKSLSGVVNLASNAAWNCVADGMLLLGKICG